MTGRQAHLLRFIHDQIAHNNQAPTFKEMAVEMGNHPSSISLMLDQLERSGHIKRDQLSHRARTISVVKLPERLPGRGLLAAEVAWCHANPERVRAMMAICGATVPDLPP